MEDHGTSQGCLCPEPHDPLLYDDTEYIEGQHPDGTPWRMIKPVIPASRPAPPRPKDVAELREWIEQKRSRWLEYKKGEFAITIWGQGDVDDLLNAARLLGLTPPIMPFPDVGDDPQHGLADFNALLRWLADTSGQPETKTADVNAQPEGDGEGKGIQREHSSALRGTPGNGEGRAPGTPVVFISSTSEDLKDYREKARDAALLAGFMPRMMEYFAASGSNPPLRACLEKVSGSPIEPPADVLVLIVAHRYGWVPRDQSGSGRKSITWLECEQAQRNGCEVLAFMVDKDHPWPDSLREEHQIAREAGKGTGTPELLAEVQSNVTCLKQFKQWIDDLASRATFTTPDSLHGQVVAALNEWRRRHVESRPRVADFVEPG